MMKSIISAAGLIAAASAYTQPGAQTYGSLLTPDLNSPVTTGQDYTITWSPKQPADGVTVSLVLCNGPGANCVLQSSAIVEKVPAAAGSYKWSVPCSLPEGVASSATGYGMLIIVDGTGEFQYSTQFSVNKGASCSSTTTTTTTTTTSSSSSSSTTGATTSTTSGSQGSTTTSASGKPSSSPASDGWYGWSSTGFNTTTVPAETTTSKYTTGPAAVTTQASASYVKPSSSAAAATTSASPKPFTGAATAPTAFVNVVGFVGAAAIAMFAL